MFQPPHGSYNLELESKPWKVPPRAVAAYYKNAKGSFLPMRNGNSVLLSPEKVRSLARTRRINTVYVMNATGNMVPMAGGAKKTALFQVPITPQDVKLFQNPPSQPHFDAKNCGLVSGQLLGLLGPKKSDIWTAQTLQSGTTIAEWSAYFNTYGKPSADMAYRFLQAPIAPESLNTVAENLFNNFATILFLKGSARPMGHIFVLSKYNDEYYIIDPQIRQVFYGQTALIDYITRLNVVPGEMFIIEKNLPRTPEEHTDDYINGFMANLIGECALAGGRRKRTRRNKRSVKR